MYLGYVCIPVRVRHDLSYTTTTLPFSTKNFRVSALLPVARRNRAEKRRSGGRANIQSGKFVPSEATESSTTQEWHAASQKLSEYVNFEELKTARYDRKRSLYCLRIKINVALRCSEGGRSTKRHGRQVCANATLRVLATYEFYTATAIGSIGGFFLDSIGACELISSLAAALDRLRDVQRGSALSRCGKV